MEWDLISWQDGLKLKSKVQGWEKQLHLDCNKVGPTSRRRRRIIWLQGRMALLVTLFLVLVNIFNAITTNSPKGETRTELKFCIPISETRRNHWVSFRSFIWSKYSSWWAQRSTGLGDRLYIFCLWWVVCVLKLIYHLYTFSFEN